METKNIISFEFEKEDRLYRLEMPHGAPLGEAYEAAGAFYSKMVELINEHAEKNKPQDPEEVEVVEASED